MSMWANVRLVADVKSGPVGSQVTVAEGGGVVECRGLGRVGA